MRRALAWMLDKACSIFGVERAPWHCEAVCCSRCYYRWQAVHPGAERVQCPDCGAMVQTIPMSRLP